MKASVKLSKRRNRGYAKIVSNATENFEGK